MDKQMAGLNVIGFTTLAASSTAAAGFTSAATTLINGQFGGKTVRRFFLTGATASARYRTDGAAPTAGTGHVLASGDSLSFTGANYRQLIKNIQFIATASTCNISITYFD